MDLFIETQIDKDIFQGFVLVELRNMFNDLDQDIIKNRGRGTICIGD